MPSFASIRSPRTPWDGLRCLQDVPKTPHTRPPGPPRRPQDGLPEPPRSLPELPQSCLNSRRASQSLPGASWEPLREPPRSLPEPSWSLPGARKMRSCYLKSMTRFKHKHLYCCFVSLGLGAVAGTQLCCAVGYTIAG